MATIGSLVVSIRATVDDFIGDMKHIQKELEETTKYVKPLKESLLGVGEAMSAVGDIVAAGMFEITKKTAEFGAELERLHQRTGISSADLSTMAVAAKQAGVQFDDVSNAFKKFASAAENASQGSKKQATAFAELGVSVTDANGALRPTGDLFLDVANKVGSMADGTQKAATMNDIFGKSGSMLIPLMNELGTEGFDNLKAKAQALGLVFSDDATKNSEQFHQALSTVEQAAEGLGATIGQQLMPIFTELMGHISSVIAAVKNWVAVHPDLTKGILLLSAAIGGTGGLVLAVAGALAVVPALTAAVTVLMGPVGIAIAAVTAFAAAFMAFPSFRAVVLNVLKNITDAVAIVGSELASVGKATIQLATGDLKGAYDTMANSWTDAMTRMQQADDGFHNALNVVTGTIQGFTTKEKEAAESETAHEAVTKKLKSAIDSVVQSIEGQKTSQLALAPAVAQAIKDGYSTADIYNQVGPAVEKYVEQLNDEGRAIPQVLQHLLDMNEAHQADLAVRIAYKAMAVDVNKALADETAGLIAVTQHTWLYDDAVTQLNTETHAAAIQIGLQKDAQDALHGTILQAIDDANHFAIGIGIVNGKIVDNYENFAAFRQILGAPAPDVFVGSVDSSLQKLAKSATETLQKATDEVKNSAGKVFDDMFVKGKNVFSSLSNALQGGVLSIGRSIFEDIVGYLGGPLKKAFDDFFSGLLESSGIKGFLSGLGSRLGGLLGSIGLGGGGQCQ
jgi:TP901 family phage tail tape measure protein